MSITSFLVTIITVAVLGGLVAIVADGLGRRIGKKKLKLGRLRPKHTAQVLTSAGGASIALMVLGVLSVTSNSVRTWLLEGDRLVAERSTLQKEITSLQDQRNAMTLQIGSLNQQMEVVQAKSNQTKARNLTLERQNQSFEMRNAGLASRNTTLTAEASRLTSEETKLNGEMHKIEATAQKRLATLDAQIKTTEAKLRVVQNDFQRSDEGNDYFMRSDLTFGIGEELARRDVDPHLTEDEASALFDEAMAESREVASEHGARARDRSPVVTLYDATDPRTHRTVTAGEERRTTIAQMTQASDHQVMIVRAGFNSFARLPVLALVEIKQNPLIYRSGETLASARVDGTQSESGILAQVQQFIRDDVGAEVRSRGMIPLDTRSEGGVGEIPMLDVITLLHSIEARNAVVTVEAVAERDTRASGPLKINFRVD